MEIFLNSQQLSLNSAITPNSMHLVNPSSVNWAQFKGPVLHTCLAGTVVASWSLTQEVADSSPFNDKYLLTLKTFRKKNDIYNLAI